MRPTFNALSITIPIDLLTPKPADHTALLVECPRCVALRREGALKVHVTLAQRGRF